jgi:hypothetical protein
MEKTGLRYKNIMARYLLLTFLSCVLFQCTNSEPPRGGMKGVPDSYEALEQFFIDWQATLEPDMINGVPDYREATMQAQYRELDRWKKRLEAMDITDWSVSQQVDWYVVWSDMNAMIFAHRVKKPWQRDPAFYVWYADAMADPDAVLSPRIPGSFTLTNPADQLTSTAVEELSNHLSKAPALWEQARTNLTGDARDLWLLGIESFRRQSEDLNRLATKMETSMPALAEAAREAAAESDGFVDWLLAEADQKNVESGVGELEYTWNLQNVHLLPYTWEDEKLLVERDLTQALAHLYIEENRNRTSEDLAGSTATRMETFKEFVQYLERVGILEANTFDQEVGDRNVGSTRNWTDMISRGNASSLSSIRRAHANTMIYNARMPSGMEAFLLQTALETKSPSSREFAWSLLAQRAARAYGALLQHGLEADHAEATRQAATWMPERFQQKIDRGELARLEHRYLQHAGLGTSYVIGRLEVERLLATYAQDLDEPFSLRTFVETFHESGQIPLSLIYWEMTGDKSMLNAALEEG